MTVPRVYIEHANVVRAFADLLESLPPGWLTEKSQEPFSHLEQAFERLDAALDEDVLEGDVELTDTANHMQKFKQASHLFNGLLLEVFRAYTAQKPRLMLQHFDTFNRVVDEMNAPCPTVDEIREEARRSFPA